MNLAILVFISILLAFANAQFFDEDLRREGYDIPVSPSQPLYRDSLRCQAYYAHHEDFPNNYQDDKDNLQDHEDNHQNHEDNYKDHRNNCKNHKDHYQDYFHQIYQDYSQA
ncbi:hypothetical protein K493DRAFT_345804 [Basidiobolus meristosporus CBS 931.73]|uniref:Uncharacterized protein n=1 Tax=Basidiobolus meristosporus CBS 931.73 TaxID=1314790 RepID=A0A1Y1Z1H5_9FUNG|nr:hypothetical protein K493DRAFT_345804 [Basidiobolus meristosporus CBS 931.73]|eukprot:ORY04059.1 hypothetical protein K493DRAFT_345804 [Basidiobolus meristosporus CBS 931.73]